MYVIVAALLARPQVVALPLARSRAVIDTWKSREPARAAHLYRSELMYAMADTRDLGSIGIWCDDHVRAVALLERTDDEVVLWDVTVGADHLDTGTMLVRSLVQSRPNMTVGHTLEDRWKIAHRFYRV